MNKAKHLIEYLTEIIWPCDKYVVHCFLDFPGSTVVKNLSANSGDAGDWGFIPGTGRSHGVGNGKPLQYSCLGNPMYRGARWSPRGHRVGHIHTHTHTHTHTQFFKT